MSSKWCVISDIDDTLFNTSIGCIPELSAFLNTFLKHPQPINGMPELYRLIQRKMFSPCFWYVSASPYNFFPYFRSNLSLEEYPNGEVLIPTWKEALKIYVLGSTYRYKLECLEKLRQYRDNSSRALICIGDTFMHDPEVYGELYRRYPDWIFIILIRVVGKRDLWRNSGVRLDKAFNMVPSGLYHVFRDPDELNIYQNFSRPTAQSTILR
jgi:phosphatidate phosphatase APP1